MKKMPAIGTRVKHVRPATRWTGERSVCGVVVAQYRGGDKHKDPETGEEYATPDHVAIQADKPLPDWWPYPGTDRIAPSIDEVEAI